MGMSLHSWVTSKLRIEYATAPALRLTVAQAARICSVEPHICRAVLDALVQAGVLSLVGDQYVRAERIDVPSPLSPANSETGGGSALGDRRVGRM